MLARNPRSLFGFEKGIIYFNHGGFGVSPKKVMDARKKILDEIEKSPLSFFDKNYRDNYYDHWREIAAMVARRFKARPEDLALVDDATDGINAVLRSLCFEPEDEILITSWTYGAIKLASEHLAAMTGARVRIALLQFPNPSPEQCLSAIDRNLTKKTKLAIFDHIASGTGIVLPIADMIKVCRNRDIPVLVDGAHAPGQVELDIEVLSPDWYVGNLHKWYFVPRASAFLWAAPSRQKNLLPNVLSWEIERPFPGCFEWTGTRDPSAWLSIPTAFQFMDGLKEEEVRHHNHALICEGTKYLAQEWGASSMTPAKMMGAMALLALPKGLPFELSDEGRGALQRALKDIGKIVAIVPSCDHARFWIRLSAQIYNDMNDFQKLAETVRRIQKNGISKR